MIVRLQRFNPSRFSSKTGLEAAETWHIDIELLLERLDVSEEMVTLVPSTYAMLPIPGGRGSWSMSSTLCAAQAPQPWYDLE